VYYSSCCFLFLQIYNQTPKPSKSPWQKEKRHPNFTKPINLPIFILASDKASDKPSRMKLNKTQLALLDERFGNSNEVKNDVIEKWQNSASIYELDFFTVYKLSVWDVIPNITLTKLINFEQLH